MYQSAEDHNHMIDIRDLEKKLFYEKIKEKAIGTKDDPSDILASA